MGKRDSTGKQDRILAYIKRREKPPTYAEIQKDCGISSTSLVAYHLKKLQAKGEISIIEGLPRGIRL